jgi:hypothetical protein
MNNHSNIAISENNIHTQAEIHSTTPSTTEGIIDQKT